MDEQPKVPMPIVPPPPETSGQGPGMLQRLLAKIEELEKRIDKLESR